MTMSCPSSGWGTLGIVDFDCTMFWRTGNESVLIGAVAWMS